MNRKWTFVFLGLVCLIFIWHRFFAWKNGQTAGMYQEEDVDRSKDIIDFVAWFEKWGPIMSNLTQIQKKAGVAIEGHIWSHDNHGFDRIPQVKAYFDHVVDRRLAIHQICETGFNGGHSTLMWAALFNGDISIVVFDLCLQNRCAVGEREIRARFPNIKLTIVPGDSRVTVPSYAKKYPDSKCDFFSVDGGHEGDVPKLDIHNFLPLATRNSTLVIDDVNVDSRFGFVRNVGQAWNHAIAQKWVIPLGECEYCFNEKVRTQKMYDHKYCFGKYIPGSI